MGKIVTIIDPPSGWQYDFPKQLPDDYMAGKINLKQWLVQNGYPEQDAEWASQHSRYWTKEIDD